MAAYESQTATLTNVASSASSVSLIAPGIGLHGRIVYNDSTAVLYLKYGAVASATSYTVQIPAQGTFTFPAPIYDGEVDGIWASANGSARITTW